VQFSAVQCSGIPDNEYPLYICWLAAEFTPSLKANLASEICHFQDQHPADFDSKTSIPWNVQPNLLGALKDIPI
jgi:hypothetical protein